MTLNYKIPLRHKFLKPAYRAGRHGYFSAEKFLRVAPSRSQWFQKLTPSGYFVIQNYMKLKKIKL